MMGATSLIDLFLAVRYISILPRMRAYHPSIRLPRFEPLHSLVLPCSPHSAFSMTVIASKSTRFNPASIRANGCRSRLANGRAGSDSRLLGGLDYGIPLAFVNRIERWKLLIAIVTLCSSFALVAFGRPEGYEFLTEGEYVHQRLFDPTAWRAPGSRRTAPSARRTARRHRAACHRPASVRSRR